MKNGIKQHHRKDLVGRPTGGVTEGVGISIEWQDGPLGRGPDRIPPNGAFVEDVIDAAIGRLEFYESSAFSCKENKEALHHLREAAEWLDRRTREREARQVEGTHVV